MSKSIGNAIMLNDDTATVRTRSSYEMRRGPKSIVIGIGEVESMARGTP